jgi:hypothetical protein
MLVYKKVLMEYGPCVTIFLSNVIDKFTYYESTNKLQADGSFFLRHEDMSAQTGMSSYELRKCKKSLKEKGLITTIMKGLPQKEFYFLHLDKLVEEYQRINPIKFRGLKVKSLEEYIIIPDIIKSDNIDNTKVLSYDPSAPSGSSNPTELPDHPSVFNTLPTLPEVDKILSYWFNLPNTVQHKQSSKVYINSIQIIDNLLNGLPIQYTKDLQPYKNLQAFCSKHSIDPGLLTKKWPVNQIKKIMRSIHKHLAGETGNCAKGISLQTVFWNSHAQNGGWSWFLFKASENSVPDQFQGMPAKLAQAMGQNLSEEKQMSWARDFQLLCNNNPVDEVNEVLDWYMQNYDWQYVKSVISCKDFCQFYKNIKKSMLSQYNNKEVSNKQGRTSFGTFATQPKEVTDSILYPTGETHNQEGDQE